MKIYAIGDLHLSGKPPSKPMEIFGKHWADHAAKVAANWHQLIRSDTENTAYLMCNLLEGVVTGGTGVRLRYKYKLMNPMGGKTGTTQKHADGWFMGVTPDLVGGVWVGAEDRSIHFQNLANGQGASMALPIWAKFLLKAYADPRLKMSDRPFDRPAGINKRLDCDETISEAEVKEMNNGIREDEEEFY